MLVFSTQLCELMPSPLLSGSTPLPLTCVNKYTVYTYIYSVWGEYRVLGFRQINICHKVPLHVNFC
jgi:hypothetical protein